MIEKTPDWSISKPRLIFFFNIYIGHTVMQELPLLRVMRLSYAHAAKDSLRMERQVPGNPDSENT